MFTHTCKERGMWRGWLKSGAALEVAWSKRFDSVGFGIWSSTGDDDREQRFLFVALGFASAYIPLWKAKLSESPEGEEWCLKWEIDTEYLRLNYGRRYKLINLPFTTYTVAYEALCRDGVWRDVCNAYGQEASEVHAYRYALKNGTVQDRIATVSQRRHILSRRWLTDFWPKRTLSSIDVEFSEEVGECSGTWKGGTIGCSYNLLSGETPLECLRRMESEREFN